MIRQAIQPTVRRTLADAGPVRLVVRVLCAIFLLSAAPGGCGDDPGAPGTDGGVPPRGDAEVGDAGGDGDPSPKGPDGGACALPALPDAPEVVATDRGALRGVERGETLAFLGVPFAAPPTGALRWRPPVERACWSEIRDAAELPPRCLQRPQQQGADEPGASVGDEDCLYLNVWRPTKPSAGAGALPVMVFIHGGGNVQGSTSNETAGTKIYDGQRMAERGQVVVVTIQYRLGMLGFLALRALSAEGDHAASGNYGLLDQIAALRWVQRNIDRFGGDPDRVMVFGESGGAVDVCMLLASPLAAGLFQRAAMQSGACVVRTLAQREVEGEALLAGLGCDAGDLACLRGLEATALVAGTPALSSDGLVGQDMGPNQDGWVLPEAPLAAFAAGTHNRVAVIVGSNADETALMIPKSIQPAQVKAAFLKLGAAHAAKLEALYPPGDSAATARVAYLRATTDAQFICQARRTARALASGQSEPVYRYSFEHVSSANKAFAALGAFHGLELLFLFQTIEAAPTLQLSEADRQVASILLAHWSTLARDGKLDRVGASGGGSAWPTYDVVGDPYLLLTATPSVGAGLRSAQCDLWDEIVASQSE